MRMSERGFAIYGEFSDDFATKILVIESSEIGDPKCRVKLTRPGEHIPDNLAYLTVDQARELIKALSEFVTHATDPKHWRNTPEYIANFRTEVEDDSAES